MSVIEKWSKVDARLGKDIQENRLQEELIAYKMGSLMNFVLVYHSYLLDPKIMPRKDTCDHARRRLESVKNLIVNMGRTPTQEKNFDFYKKKCQDLKEICNDCYSGLYNKKV